MKKYIVLLLCLMMLLMMVACGETTPTTIGSDTNPSSNTQQNPTEPTKPADGTVDPEDPSLSAYEKEFYQRFNEGQRVTLRIEDINIAISIHGQSGKLLAKVSISGYEEKLPTLEGECEGKFQYEFQMFYENDIVKGENGDATCHLKESQTVIKRSGDFTDEIAQKYLEYMKTQELTQKQQEDLAAILAGEPVADYNIIGEDVSLGFSAKESDGIYTDIRVDCYDGEEIECYFLVLEDMIQQIAEYSQGRMTVAYSLSGLMLYEERSNGENYQRISYIYDDAEVLLRIDVEENGEVIAVEEYTYDESGNKIATLRYYNGRLSQKMEYDSEGTVITNLEYDENGNIDRGFETKRDASGKIVEKIAYLWGSKVNVTCYDENGREISDTSYYENGEVDSVYEYAYDDAGNLVQETCRSSDGSYDIVCYDAEGNVLSWVRGEGEERWEETWDHWGNILSYYWYRNDEPMEWQLYTYNEDGQMLSSVAYGEDSSGEIGFLCKSIYYYNEKSLLVRVEDYYYEDSQIPDLVETYKYDPADRLIRNYIFDRDGSLMRWNEYTYNAEGKPITWIHYRGEGTDIVERREEWRYDANGDCIHNLAYDAEGNILIGFTSEFDENGKLVQKIDYDTYFYEVVRYVSDNYMTRHIYDRDSDELFYWVECWMEGDYIIEEIYHYPE